MRRMHTDPGELIECSFENRSNVSIVYIPNIKLEDFPISFEVLITYKDYSPIVSFRVTILYNAIDTEVRGGGIFTTPEGNNAQLTSVVDSLIDPEGYPVLTMEAEHLRGDMTTPPIDDRSHIYIRNIVHLSKQLNNWQ